MNASLTLLPGNVGIDHDPLTVDIEAPAHRPERRNSLFGLVHLLLGDTLGNDGLGFRDAQDIASPLWQ